MNLIVKAVIRIIVVFAAVQGLSYFIAYISQVYTSGAFQGSDRTQALGAIAVAAVVLALLFWAVWSFSGRIARALVGHVDVNTLQINSSTVDAYQVGVSLIGVYLLVTNLPVLFSLAARQVFYGSPAVDTYAVNNVGAWIQSGTELLIGLSLTFSAGRMLAVFKRIWTWAATGGSETGPE